MITRQQFGLLLGLAAFCWFTTGGAAELNPWAGLNSEYHVSRWTVEDGLPQSFVRAMVQTPDGYLWLGTLNGLARFDGNRFKVFDHSNAPEMVHESINALACDLKTGGLWIGTGAGLLYYEHHRFRRFALSDTAPVAVGVLEPSRQGGVWFSARAGQVGLVRDGQLATWQIAPGSIGFQVFQILEEGPESILVSMADTNCLLDWKHRQIQAVTQALPPDVCHRFFRDLHGTFWVCGNRGLWRQAGTNWVQEIAARRPARPWPDQIGQTRDGRMLVLQAEAGGTSLQALVNGGLHPVLPAESPFESKPICWLEDYEGNLWVGCKTGLLRLEQKHLRIYSRRDGLANDEVKILTESPDGAIWVTTGDGRLSSIRDGKVSNLAFPFMSFAADNLGRMWGFEPDALERLDGGTPQTISTPPDLPQLGFNRIYEDRERRMWLGTGHGILRLEGTKWIYLPIRNAPDGVDVRVIHQDRRGDMWFGTFRSGLWRLHDGQLTQYTTGRGPENNRAWWIHEDAEGIFWIGSEEGLNRFVPPGLDSLVPSKSTGSQNESRAAFFTFTTREGLSENIVNNIQEDQFGYLWLSGLRGIYRISRLELNEVAEGKRAEVGCLALGEADGMLSCECNGGDDQPSGCRDRQGRIWFPTTQGVAVVDPAEFRQEDIQPRVVIEGVKANNQVIYGDDAKVKASSPSAQGSDSAVPAVPGFNNQPPELQIRPGGARLLEIYYTANSFTAPGRVRFKYRLDGFSQEWESDDSNRRVALFTNLRPGNYTFRLRAANNRGVWSQPDTLMTFSIAPFFYQTTPFRAGCVVLIFLLAWAVHHARLKGLDRLRTLQQQHALDVERARISRDIHDDLGSRFLQISVLGELTQRTLAAAGDPVAHLGKLRATAGDAFQALDEIVWAVNPRQDSLAGLLSYLREFAPQFLGPAGIQCRLDFPNPVPDLRLAAQTRHEVFLVVKEALQNIVKHARAKEVALQLAIEGKRLLFSIRDDGVGLAENGRSLNGNGMDNMRHRLSQLGGALTVLSQSGQGTELRFELGCEG